MGVVDSGSGRRQREGRAAALERSPWWMKVIKSISGILTGAFVQIL